MPLGEHINSDGEFQSDKYLWCLPGFVPLKLTDPMAWPVLWEYARVRESVDAVFAEDLRTALRSAGYAPSALPETLTEDAARGRQGMPAGLRRDLEAGDTESGYDGPGS